MGGTEALIFAGLALSTLSTVVTIAAQPDPYVPEPPRDDSAVRAAQGMQEMISRQRGASNERFTRNQGTLGSVPVSSGLGMPTLISSDSASGQGGASSTASSNSTAAPSSR